MSELKVNMNVHGSEVTIRYDEFGELTRRRCIVCKKQKLQTKWKVTQVDRDGVVYKTRRSPLFRRAEKVFAASYTNRICDQCVIEAGQKALAKKQAIP